MASTFGHSMKVPSLNETGFENMMPSRASSIWKLQLPLDRLEARLLAQWLKIRFALRSERSESRRRIAIYKVDNEACTVWRILACRRSPVRRSRALTKQP
jgi:hypothetical protein